LGENTDGLPTFWRVKLETAGFWRTRLSQKTRKMGHLAQERRGQRILGPCSARRAGGIEALGYQTELVEVEL